MSYLPSASAQASKMAWVSTGAISSIKQTAHIPSAKSSASDLLEASVSRYIRSIPALIPRSLNATPLRFSVSFSLPAIRYSI